MPLNLEKTPTCFRLCAAAIGFSRSYSAKTLLLSVVHPVDVFFCAVEIFVHVVTEDAVNVHVVAQ